MYCLIAVAWEPELPEGTQNSVYIFFRVMSKDGPKQATGGVIPALIQIQVGVILGKAQEKSIPNWERHTPKTEKDCSRLA